MNLKPSSHKSNHTEPFSPFSLITLIFIICSSILLSFFARQYENNNILSLSEAENRHIASILKNNMSFHFVALERMAQRWRTRNATPKEEWEYDAKAYVEDMPAFQAIEWVDTSYHVRWIIPMEGNEAAQGLDILSEQKRAESVKKAVALDEIIVTPSIDLVQGGKGFLSYFPLFLNNGEFNGLILGVFRIKELLQTIIDTEDITNFDIRVMEGDTLLFKTSENAVQEQYKWEMHTPLEFYRNTWEIYSSPKLHIIQSERTWVPAIILIFGFILALLLFFIINLYKHRIQSTQELEYSQNRLQSIFDNAQAGLFTYNENGELESFNPAAEIIFGYAQEEVLGEQMTIILPIAMREEVQKLFHNYLLTGETQFVGKRREIFGRRKNGEEFAMEVMVSELKSQSTRLFNAIVSDISERKRTERERETLIQELRTSNDNLEQFARAASHDLKEPLRSVSNYLELLKRKHLPEITEDASRYIDLSVKSAQRMNEMVEGLLRYSLIQMDQSALDETDLNETLNDVLSQLHDTIEKNQAKIKRVTLPTIMANRTQMLQLFQNLINNAIKYRGKNSPIIDINMKQEKGMWQFSVQDNGIGFESQYQEHVFKLFKRLHTQTEYEGNGIGLAMCMRIVKRHHGEMWVTSEPGKGSTFFFTLPVDIAST